MAKVAKRGRPKSDKMFSVQVKRSEHGELYDLFTRLAKEQKLSGYIREGVRLIHLIEKREWDLVLNEYPEFYEFLAKKTTPPQIIVQGGGYASPSDVTPIQLDTSVSRRNEDDEDAFNRIFGDIGLPE